MDTYTLVLTKGTHVVDEVAIRLIEDALRYRRPWTVIRLDPFGAVDQQRFTTIVTSHIVYWTKNAPRAEAQRPLEAVR